MAEEHDVDAECNFNQDCIHDKLRIMEMHEKSLENAAMYVSVILVFYFIGLVVLFIHHLKSKYFEVSSKRAPAFF